MEDSKVVRMYPEAIRWSSDGRAIEIIDQRELPGREAHLLLFTTEEVANAITTMAVRGAPAIGIAAAMAVALDPKEQTIELLAATRPTAVNLFWALDRMRRALREGRD
ncbi:MAG TPA: hypothetical protein VM100_10845, partial [Longimicrobiales bacterium]|nr:hypothetical protein [Longimicrobiales bacterium]